MTRHLFVPPARSRRIRSGRRSRRGETVAGVSSGIEKGLMDQYSYLVFGTTAFHPDPFLLREFTLRLTYRGKARCNGTFFFYAMTSESTKMSDSQV